MNPSEGQPGTRVKRTKATGKIKRFAECASLEDIALESCSLRVNREDSDSKGKLSMEFSVNTSTEGDAPLRFTARCICKIKGTTADAKHEIVNLDLEYVARYTCNDVYDWPDDELDFFAGRNVILHVWPYLREFIDQITRRANLTRILLPLVPPSAVVQPRKQYT